MPELDEAASVFDVIATEEHTAPAKPETPVETNTDKNESEESEKESALNGDRQDFSRPTGDEPEATETEEVETKTEPLETNTETETAKTETETNTNTETPVEDDWKLGLPPPPQPYNGPAPQIDEDGQVTNMTAAEYAQYIKEVAKAEMRAENYTQTVENRALDEAEKILPELKTNPTVRNLLQSIRVAQVVNGQAGDAVSAAREIRTLLGEYKAQGANNAKTHIEVTKNARVETPNNQTQKESSKVKALDKRLRAGDDAAFAELFNLMDEQGKL